MVIIKCIYYENKAAYKSNNIKIHLLLTIISSTF